MQLAGFSPISTQEGSVLISQVVPIIITAAIQVFTYQFQIMGWDFSLQKQEMPISEL